MVFCAVAAGVVAEGLESYSQLEGLSDLGSAPAR